MKRPTGFLLLLGIALLVFFITREIYRPVPDNTRVDATVLLERVRMVLKLVTVEGEFTELYDHTDQWNWRFAVPGLTEKRAIIRVKARVSVGYDLDGIQLSADERTKTITIGAEPSPTILSMEHDIDYYDLNEGLFNHFDERELSALSAKAKDRIRTKVPESGLFAAADAQRDELLEVVRTLVEATGWQLVLDWESRDARSRFTD